MGLVGLYACSVRRLEVRKRKTCKFIGFIGFLGFIGLLRSCGCFAWFVLLLLRSCSLLGVVVLLVALFPFGRYGKRKGAPCWRVLSLWVVGLLYAHKLIQIVPGFIGSKISPSGCGVLYFAGSPPYFAEIAIFHGFACFIYLDFDAAPVTYCEGCGWCKSCHFQKCFL